MCAKAAVAAAPCCFRNVDRGPLRPWLSLNRRWRPCRSRDDFAVPVIPPRPSMRRACARAMGRRFRSPRTDSELWRYDGADCAVFFFLYREGDAMRIRYTESMPRGMGYVRRSQMRGKPQRAPRRDVLAFSFQ
jgi:hypothetical protein